MVVKSNKYAAHSVHDSLFKHIVCRVGGIPVEQVEKLRLIESYDVLQDLFEVEEQLTRNKESLSERLHAAVKAAKCDTNRKQLITLRRDVYNLRPLDTHLGNVLLTDDQFDAVQSFIDLQSKLHALELKYEVAFTREVPAVRDAFKAILNDDAFQKGLLISSNSLYRSQEKYRAPFKVNLKGKIDKVERGLVRYFTRMAMKATPYGTFCSVIPGEIKQADQFRSRANHYVLSGDLQKKKSAFRLNKSLYLFLFSHLKKRPTVRRHLYLELNPTLHKIEHRYVYLSVINGLETFQRIGLHPIVVMLEAILGKHRLTYVQLVQAIQDQPRVENSEEEIAQFLDKLIEIGLLSFRTGIPEQEAEWHIPLCDVLRPIDDEHAEKTIALLTDLSKLLAMYGDAGIKERAVLLAQMNVAIDESFESMGIVFRLPTNLPFFEDGTAEAEAVVYDNSIKHISYHLDTLIRNTLPLAWPRSEMFSMRHFFDTYYGKDVESVPLLQFYEDYYREHFKAHLDFEGKTKKELEEEGVTYNGKNPFNINAVERILTARSSLRELVLKKWGMIDKYECVNISESELLSIVKNAPQISGYASISFFGQFVPGDTGKEGSSRFILAKGAYNAGYGKFFSRFLYLFTSDEIEEKIKADNADTSGVILAEICGESSFNANFHPPLMDWEINYPMGESGVSDKQLDAHTLNVQRDARDTHALILNRDQGEGQVLPIDLGFLSTNMRPPLYQLLIRFAPPSGYQFPVPERHTEQPDQLVKKAANEVAIEYRPRIVYEEAIVLARARWRIPASLFPHRQSNETLDSYFLRVNRWRTRHRLPEEGYFRVIVKTSSPTEVAENDKVMGEDSTVSEKENTDSKPTKNERQADLIEKNRQARRAFTRMSKDFSKPQYIDFKNPLLVNLFGKVAVNLTEYFVDLEERYPTKDGLPGNKGGHYANEFVAQLNFEELSEKAHAFPINSTQPVHVS